jgi:hypothetical protein
MGFFEFRKSRRLDHGVEYWYLGFMRVWNILSPISDTWSWGEVTTCALYDTEKMRTASPKSYGSHCLGQHTSSQPRCDHVRYQASQLSFAVNCSPWKNTTSNLVVRLSPEGGHSWWTGQSLYNQNHMLKIAHSNQWVSNLLRTGHKGTGH